MDRVQVNEYYESNSHPQRETFHTCEIRPSDASGHQEDDNHRTYERHVEFMEPTSTTATSTESVYRNYRGERPRRSREEYDYQEMALPASPARMGHRHLHR